IQRDRRALHRDEGSDRRLRAVPGPVQGRGDRMDQAVPRRRRRRRERNSPALRGAGLQLRRREVKGDWMMGDQATRYRLGGYRPAGGVPRPEVLREIMREVEAVNRELKAAGAWVFGGGLQPQKVAKVVWPKAGVVHATDGPFAETKEFLGGLI